MSCCRLLTAGEMRFYAVMPTSFLGANALRHVDVVIRLLIQAHPRGHRFLIHQQAGWQICTWHIAMSTPEAMDGT